MLSFFHARNFPSIKRLSHGSSLFPGTLSTRLKPIDLRNRHPSFSGSLQRFGSESPQQGSMSPLTVFHPGAHGMFQHGFRSRVAVVGFLNAMLGFEGQNAITRVEFLSNDHSSGGTLNRQGNPGSFDLTCFSCDGKPYSVMLYNKFWSHDNTEAVTERFRMASLMESIQSKRGFEENFSTARTGRHVFGETEGWYSIIITDKLSKSKAMKKNHPQEHFEEPHLVNLYEFHHEVQPNLQFPTKHYRSLIIFAVNNLMKFSTAELVSPAEEWAYVFQDSMLMSKTDKIPETRVLEGMDCVMERNPSIKAFIDRIRVDTVPSDVLNKYLQDMSRFNADVVD
jgi:hypothetical protein